jgi:hypothetical protein
MNPPPAICRAQGVHELPKKHSPDKRPLFPKTGARSTTGSLEMGCFQAAFRSP